MRWEVLIASAVPLLLIKKLNVAPQHLVVLLMRTHLLTEKLKQNIQQPTEELKHLYL